MYTFFDYFHQLYLAKIKVNSVHEACAKCFVVHMMKLEILQIAWKRGNKKHQTNRFQFSLIDFRGVINGKAAKHLPSTRAHQLELFK